MEGEKENEDMCNDGGSNTTSKRKRAEMSQKRRKHTDQSGVNIYREFIESL